MQSSYKKYFENIYNQLWIKVIPLFSRYEGSIWILIYLTDLLKVSDPSEQENKTVESISRAIYEIPQVTQIAANAFVKYFLRFLPHKPDNIDNNE